MPVKIRFGSGKVLLLDDGDVTCAEDPELADDLRRMCGTVGAEVPDPDMHRALIIKANMECELFDATPFNMDRSDPNAAY